MRFLPHLQCIKLSPAQVRFANLSICTSDIPFQLSEFRNCNGSHKPLQKSVKEEQIERILPNLTAY